MKNQQILVLGGTGKTGRRIIERLNKLGKSYRVGSRNAHFPFDWEEPTTWDQALEGIDILYITFQPDLAVPGAVDAIKALTSLAKQKGVQKMVLLSGRGEHEAQQCEQIVMNAGTHWTIVRASWFNQNFSESFFLEPVLAGHIALPRGETLEPFIDVDDIADVVVAALLNDKHNGQVYELTGPQLLTFEQIALEIAKATGRNIHYQSITMDEYQQMLQQHQVPESYIWLINYLFTEVLDGRNSGITHDVEKVLGRKPKDFAAYAQEVAATGVWNPAN